MVYSKIVVGDIFDRKIFEVSLFFSASCRHLKMMELFPLKPVSKPVKLFHLLSLTKEIF